MRVLLIDDHALFRGGLEALLERRSIEVIAAGNGENALQLVNSIKPDIVLLDLRMPQIDGLDVLQQFHSATVHVPVVILTTSDDEEDLVRSLQMGARGYLLKDMHPDDLVASLQRIQAGKTEVAPVLAEVLARVVQHGGLIDEKDQATVIPFDDLTRREREILCLVAGGKSNKVIARDLGISDGTVKLHVKAILRKLSVHSRVEAAVMAVEQGLCQRETVGT